MTDRDYLLRAIDHFVASGYYTEELADQLDDIVNDLVGRAPEPLMAELRARVADGLAARRAEEAGWTEETLNDRLEEAFAELEDSGIVAVENAGNHRDEAWVTCFDLSEGMEAPPRGGVFFLGPDVEEAVAGRGLSLTFGAFEDNDPATIGREVCDVLAKYGIPTTWSGDPADLILIPPFTWKKRQFTAPP